MAALCVRPDGERGNSRLDRNGSVTGSLGATFTCLGREASAAQSRNHDCFREAGTPQEWIWGGATRPDFHIVGLQAGCLRGVLGRKGEENPPRWEGTFARGGPLRGETPLSPFQGRDHSVLHLFGLSWMSSIWRVDTRRPSRRFLAMSGECPSEHITSPIQTRLMMCLGVSVRDPARLRVPASAVASVPCRQYDEPGARRRSGFLG